MATGIQTGLGRTGTGIAPPGKAPNQNGMAKVMATWGGLTPKTRILSIIGVLAVLIVALSTFVIVESSKYVPLYSFNLSDTDQKEIVSRLTTDNYPFTVETGKIMVPPGKRQQMATYLLESCGLPHRPLDVAKQDGGMIPPSDKEKEHIQLQQLQADLIEQMRVLSFVADAYVQIVPADEDGALMGSPKPATAQVMLQLKPGAAPSHEQINAIVSMVSYSVRGLDPNNVKVMDDQGRILSRPTSGSGNSADAAGGADSSDDVGLVGQEDLNFKNATEKQYRDKATAALDKIFGADRYTLTVDADIDFSQKKVTSLVHGDTKPLETSTKTEAFNSNPGSNGSPASNGGSKDVALANFNNGSGAAGGTKTGYNLTETKTKNDVDTTTREVVTTAPTVRKVTASLAVDRNLTDEQVKKWSDFLMNQMGMDPSRGDTVSVLAAAFADPGAVKQMKDLMPAGGAYAPHDQLNAATVAVVGGGCMLILLGLVSVFLMKQHKVQVDKSSLLLSTGGGSHTTEITDLLNEKSGKATAGGSQTTTVNNRAELEKLAKEKPTRVAELLKSTWLSEKER